MKFLRLSLAALLFVAPSCSAAPVALAPALPVPAPVGTDFDLQKFVDGAVQAGQKKIVVPPGRYRVTPHDRQHLVLANLHDIEIVADGVEMICTQTTRAVSIANCSNLTLRGLSVDYDPLPYTQGRITAISPDHLTLDVELFDGYPAAQPTTKLKYELFKANTRTLRVDAPSAKAIEVVDARHFRISNKAAGEDQVGDLVVINTAYAPDGQVPHAFYISDGHNITLENINLWASNSFGFYESQCDGTTYRNCRIDRRPAASDLIKRADARLRSTNADAYHSNAAAKGPQILGCTAHFMGDDAVNIRGQYSMVTATDNGQYRVLVNGQSLAVGDAVELWTYAGVRLPDAVVTKVEKDGQINDAERAFLSQQRMDARFRTAWSPDAIRVTLDRAADLPLGSLIGSTKRVGNGFLVQGNDFGFNRSRGILIKGSQGAVKDNVLTQNLGAAILVAPEYWWLEAGSASDVTISGNRIENCAAFPIDVMAVAGQGGLAPSGAHRAISIVNNTISGSGLPNIVATSTADLRIEGNVLTPDPNRKIPGWMLYQLGLDKGPLDPIMTINSADAVIAKNVVK